MMQKKMDNSNIQPAGVRDHVNGLTVWLGEKIMTNSGQFGTFI
jgi:hypothetical protein